MRKRALFSVQALASKGNETALNYTLASM